MKVLFFSILTLFAGIIFSFSLTAKNDTVSPKTYNEFRFKNDTLKLETISTPNSTNRWWDDKNMPWIIAGLSSLITVFLTAGVNYLNAKRSEKVAVNNIVRQTETSTTIALDQIKNAKELSLTEFKATLKSKNRQEWINEVRHCISEYLTQNRMLNIEYQNPHSSIEKIQIHFEKAGYNYNKIFLLLNHNPANTEHKKLLDLIRGLSSLMDEQSRNTPHRNDSVKWNNTDEMKKQNLPIGVKQEEILKSGMELLYSEWRKIQAMEN